MKQKYLLLVLWILTGCVGQKQNSEDEVSNLDIPLRKTNYEVMMSTFVDSISYIPLETKDECLIGSIDKIIVTDNYYYIVDKTISYSVFCFDKSGKFIHKLSNRGVGSGEYMRINDVDIYKDNVYIWDCSLQKLFIFDHSGRFIEERKFDYMAESFSVLDDSWIVFYADYKDNGKYSCNNSYPNVLFVNIDNKQTKSDLFFDSRMSFPGIMSSPFNFVSNGNLVTSLNDTIYQALPSVTLKRKYVVRFGEQNQKAKKDYIEKLRTETVDLYQGRELRKNVPYVYAFLETPSYSFLKYNLGDYYYWGIINHKESDAYVESSGYKKMNVVNDMDSIAIFMPLVTYKNAVYSYRSPDGIISGEAFKKHIEPDDNPIIVKFELK